ncbi:MAG: nucleotidyltransferase domain-containing protein [Candidatus Hydrogenedentes bacterium]|nr:nucleotidyltransferase domain-containing protein [Candidatus Hydrogenedentota bacterium]
MSTAIEIPAEAIARICREFGVAELALFGSVTRDDFSPESDVDFLVVFRDEDAGPWLSKFGALEAALGGLLGRKVDVVDKRAVEGSENYIRRKHILDSAQILYVA